MERLQRMPFIERMRLMSGTAGCWVWPGAKTKWGYARCHWHGKARFTHCIAYIVANGAIPADLEIDHLCRNPACFNPAHLEAVTPKVNSLRSTSIPAKNAKKTHCKYGHEFTPENTREIRTTCGIGRSCKTCERMRSMKQARAAGVEPRGLMSHCLQGHPLTPENTITRRNGHRRCRACDKKLRREWARGDRRSRGVKLRSIRVTD